MVRAGPGQCKTRCFGSVKCRTRVECMECEALSTTMPLEYEAQRQRLLWPRAALS
jgi:hypothetical protein